MDPQEEHSNRVIDRTNIKAIIFDMIGGGIRLIRNNN